MQKAEGREARAQRPRFLIDLQLVLEKVDLQKKINLGYLLLAQEKDRGRVPALRLNQERDAAELDRQRAAAPG